MADTGEGTVVGRIRLDLIINNTIREQIGKLAQTAQSSAKQQFEKLGAASGRTLSDAMGKSMSGLQQSVGKAGAAISQSMAAAVDRSVANAQLKVKEAAASLDVIGEKLDAMRNKKRIDLADFYPDPSRLNAAMEKSLNVDKAYQKLVEKADAAGRKLAAAEDRLAQAQAASAQKAAAKVQAMQAKAQEASRRAIEKQRAMQERAQLAAAKAEAAAVAQAQKAAAKRRVIQQKQFKSVFGKMGSMAGGAGKAIGKAFGSVGKKVGRVLKNIKTAFKSAILMASLYAAFRAFKDVISGVVKQNDQFQRSLNLVKANLATAFVPIINAVMPALNALMSGLAYASKKMAEFTSAFFGTTYAQSVTTMKKVQSVQGAAKKAKQGALASFDEINKLEQGGDADEGGTDYGALDTAQYGEAGQLADNIEAKLVALAEKIPAFFAAALTKLTAFAPRFVEVAVSVLSAFIRSVNDHFPEILTAGIAILATLMQGIQQLVPDLAPLGVNIITALIEAFLTCVPSLIASGIELLAGLLTGLAQKMPELIPMAQEAIRTIITALINNLPQILTAGMDILLALIDGIIEMLPELIPAVTRICTQLEMAVISRLPEIIQLGVDLIIAIVEGLMGSMGVIIDCAPEMVGALVAGLIGAIPQLIDGVGRLVEAIADKIINTDWIQVGKDIIRGVIDGFMSGWTKLKEMLHIDGKAAIKSEGSMSVGSFAAGGIIRQPQLAVVGDNPRSPEAVAPLHELYGMIRQAVREERPPTPTPTAPAQPMTVIVQIGGQQVTEWVADGSKQTNPFNGEHIIKP